MPRILLAAAVVSLVTTTGTLGFAGEPAGSGDRDNPLLLAWTGPYGGVPPLDRLPGEDLPPPLHAGMGMQRRAIAAITDNPAPPSFDNTVVALERSGGLLRRAQSMYLLWTTSISSPAVRELARRMQPLLAAHQDELNHNPRLFERVEAVYQS